MRARCWPVQAAALLGLVISVSANGNGEVARLLDNGLAGEGKRGGRMLVRRMGGARGFGRAVRTVGMFSFQGNHEEESLGEDGGSTVPNSVARPDEKLGESVRAGTMSTTQLGEAYASSTASPAPPADTSWQGSFNLTHGKAQPATDGKLYASTFTSGQPIPKTDTKTLKGHQATLGGCLTQVPVTVTSIEGAKPRVARSKWQCTSCKPGYYLQIRTHKAMAGDCLTFRQKPQLHCAALGSNVYSHDWADGDRLCTKAGHLKQLLRIDALKDATARKHFAALRPGSWQSNMEAHCRAWKQAVCQGRTCRVKKNVKCLKVCRRKLATGYFVDKCSSKYCEGQFGAMVCKEMAAAF